jgi:hypothetical protein
MFDHRSQSLPTGLPEVFFLELYEPLQELGVRERRPQIEFKQHTSSNVRLEYNGLPFRSKLPWNDSILLDGAGIEISEMRLSGL